MNNTLPDILPIFPLTGVLLLPRGQLPLNIFEPRYLGMVDAALSSHRMIGMIQPRLYGGEETYDIGCAGRITSYEETDDGRYLITLTGVSRFRVSKELPLNEKGFRSVMPDWSVFAKDVEEVGCLDIDRDRLLILLEKYFDMQGMSCQWDKVRTAPDAKLMTCLAMVCPFDASEKQALLETKCCKERAEKFMAMLDIAIKEGHTSCSSGCKH